MKYFAAHPTVISVANADARPRWKPDSFFRRYASAGND
jgi:hypothetical protein